MPVTRDEAKTIVETLNYFGKQFLEASQNVLKEGKSIPMTAIAINTKAEVAYVLIGKHESNDDFIARVRNDLASERMKDYPVALLAAEAYMSVFDSVEYSEEEIEELLKSPPSRREDAQDVVIVSINTRGGITALKSWVVDENKRAISTIPERDEDLVERIVNDDLSYDGNYAKLF